MPTSCVMDPPRGAVNCPEQKSPIECALDQLKVAREELKTSAGLLCQRLRPVCSPDAAKTPGEPTDNNKLPVSRVTERIASETEELRLINQRLNCVLDSLEC